MNTPLNKLRLIRGSEVDQYQKCRRTWKLRWYDRLVRKHPDKKLFFGTMFHKHMEHLYQAAGNEYTADMKTQAWIQKQDISMADVEYKELIDMFWKIAKQYRDFYVKDFGRMEIVSTELQFAIPLYEDNPTDPYAGRLNYAYTGTIDLIYFEDGKLKFKDYKTTSSIDRYVDNITLDRQIRRYWWALTGLCHGYGYILDAETGKWIDVKDHPVYRHIKDRVPEEFCYDLIRKDVAQEPKLIKKGKELSKAKDQNTTPEIYKKALVQNGFWDGMSEIPEEYQEIVQHLEAQGNKFLRRVSIVLSTTACQNAMEDFHRVAREIMEMRYLLDTNPALAEQKLSWTITYDTKNMNQYYPIIAAELEGENTSYVITGLFEKEDHDPETDFLTLIN